MPVIRRSFCGDARANRCGSASTGPLVSPVLTASTWDAPVVPMDEGDHLLLYTDGVSETLADEDGRAEERFTSAIDRAPEGGAPLLDAILADVHHELAGQPQPDDLTLLTATVTQPGGVGSARWLRPGHEHIQGVNATASIGTAVATGSLRSWRFAMSGKRTGTARRESTSDAAPPPISGISRPWRIGSTLGLTNVSEQCYFTGMASEEEGGSSCCREPLIRSCCGLVDDGAAARLRIGGAARPGGRHSLPLNQGTLYAALVRLEQTGLDKGRWQTRRTTARRSTTRSLGAGGGRWNSRPSAGGVSDVRPGCWTNRRATNDTWHPRLTSRATRVRKVLSQLTRFVIRLLNGLRGSRADNRLLREL